MKFTIGNSPNSDVCALREYFEASSKWFEISAVEHCNLNCAGCNHFSPLAKKEFLSLTQLEKDLKAFTKLLQGKFGGFKIAGGEPLSHPNIIEIIKMCRLFIGDKPLQLYTNGILLNKMPDKFYECLKSQAVEIHIGNYLNLSDNANKHLAKFDELGIKAVFSRKGQSDFIKVPLNQSGEQNIEYNWYNQCCYAGMCNFIKNGRIYPCICTGSIEHFNNYFDKKFEITDKDYFDLHNQYLSYEDFVKFITRPIPFCRYCDFANKKTGLTWSASKKEIGEWV